MEPFTDLRAWFKAMLDHGGTFESEDDPRRRLIGMRETDSGKHFLVSLQALQEGVMGVVSEENRELSWAVRPLIKTPGARARLAHLLTVRDLPGAILQLGEAR